MLWQLIDHGRSPEFEWLVIFLEGGSLAEDIRKLGVDVQVIEAGRMRDLVQGARAVRSVHSLLREREVNLVVGWMADAHIYAAPGAWLAGVPAVWCQLGIPTLGSWIYRLATLLPAREILACSEAVAREQRRLRPRRPVRVVHPGVDFRGFDPRLLPDQGQARKQLSLPEGVPLLGFVGRLERWKGPHVLVEAMPAILAAHPQTQCVLVGEVHERNPEYAELLSEQIAALGLSNHIRMVGAQSNPELWMTAMDIVVHASDAEPFGLVVVEALALGKPVIAGAEGGPAEIITSGIDGVLTRYGDDKALASAVIRVLDDPAFAKALGDAGKERAKAFSSETYAAKMMATLREAG